VFTQPGPKIVIQGEGDERQRSPNQKRTKTVFAACGTQRFASRGKKFASIGASTAASAARKIV
ncbi:hypothetical protein, partial [Ensifer aridi]|uniref:hypothetical protein n=1 Tax=Ensifer aridi TaxID=1708715 RepID=UPI001AEC8FC8